MKILFCTTFFDHTHNGAGQFAQHIFQLNNQDPTIDLRILSEDLDESKNEDADKKYFLDLKQINFSTGLELMQRAKHYQNKALDIYNSFPFDLIFFNNAVLGIQSQNKFNSSVRRMGFVHDDNYVHFGWSNFSFSKKWLYRHIQRRFEKRAAQKLDHVFTNSNYLKSELSSEYNIPNKSITQLYVSVNLEKLAFDHSLKINAEETIKILFVKNEFKRGGLEDLVQAIHHLSSKYKLTLTIIGPLPDQANAIEKIAQAKNYTLNFEGNQSQEFVFAAMRSHHLLCIPSRLEAQGVTNIEGMAIGIPVITTSVGGIPEVTDNGNHAWIANPNSPKQLAEVIDSCITNPKLRNKKSKTARDYVFQKFSVQKMLNNFLATIS